MDIIEKHGTIVLTMNDSATNSGKPAAPVVHGVVMCGYSDRRWLNRDGHPSTGSVVAYHGESPWDRDGKPDVMTILEISDCHSKVRLHRSEKDTLEEFIEKMETLRDVVAKFVDHLRST